MHRTLFSIASLLAVLRMAWDVHRIAHPHSVRDLPRLVEMIRAQCPPLGQDATMTEYLRDWGTPLTARSALRKYNATWEELFDPSDLHPFVAADFLARACSAQIAFATVDILRYANVTLRSDDAYIADVARAVISIRPFLLAGQYVSEAEVFYTGQRVLEGRVAEEHIARSFRGSRYYDSPAAHYASHLIHVSLGQPAVVDGMMHVVLAAHAMMQIPGLLLAFE